jgi:hypothetical protein
VLGLAASFLFAVQFYGLVREEDLTVLSSLSSSSIRGGASNTVDNIKAATSVNPKIDPANFIGSIETFFVSFFDFNCY